MGYSTEALGAAHLALAMVWCGTMQVPELIGEPQFVWPGTQSPQSRSAAAEYLADRPKPSVVFASLHDRFTLALDVRTTDEASRRSHSVDLTIGSPGEDDRRVLVLAVGRAFRASRATIRRLAEDYRLDSSVNVGGSPPDDLWTVNLGLPATWLDGVSFVYLLGRNAGNGQSFSAVRTSAGFDADAIEDV